MEQPVHRLSAEKILAVWEAGQPQHPLDRALTILAAASPGASRDQLADLSVGERDARLLQLRARVFGAHAEGFAECPECAARIEFPVDTAAFTQPPKGRTSASPVKASAEHEIELAGKRVRFRLPNSRDLADVVTAPDNTQALHCLIERCIFPHDGDLPNDALEAVGRVMLTADPQSEITLDLTCPACGHRWELLFDIAEFFWAEISARAQRLLREIDALARAYGWTEREILDLPARRRQSYLELVAA